MQINLIKDKSKDPVVYSKDDYKKIIMKAVNRSLDLYLKSAQGKSYNSIDEEVKLLKIEFLLQQLFSAFLNNQLIESRFLASFLGKLSHAFYSHGNFVKIVARMSNHTLGRNICDSGWDSSLLINGSKYLSFKIIANLAELFNALCI